jgi:hypothetical protein
MYQANRFIRCFLLLSLGVLFVFSGLVKGNDIVGTTIKFKEYFNAFGLSYFSFTSTFFAISLSAIEFLIGVSFLLRVNLKLAFYATIGFMGFFTILTFLIAILNNVSDCGCFGDAVELTNWETFFKNIIIDLIVVILYTCQNKCYILNSRKSVTIALSFLVLFIGFSQYTYYNLPLVDFRPYKVGENIKDKISVENSEDNLIYSFIYEKNGESKEFEMENLPDSTWAWKETITKQKDGNSQKLLTDFVLTNSDKAEVTGDIVEMQQVYLLCVYDLNNLSTLNIEKIQEIVNQIESNALSVFVVVANTVEETNKFQAKFNVELQFLYSDKKVIQTIVRSTPGLVLFQNGVIIKKWSHINFPMVDEIRDLILM